MSNAGFDAAAVKKMTADPIAAQQLISQVKEVVKTSGADYLTAFHQSFRWEAEDYLAFAQLWADFHTGALAIFRVEVGSGPGADADREANAASLTAVFNPFAAHLDMAQNNYFRGDGTFEWTADVVGTAGDDEATLEPSTVPLEVGSSRAATTLLHTYEHGGVARWPYDSQDIVVIRRLTWPQGEPEEEPPTPLEARDYAAEVAAILTAAARDGHRAGIVMEDALGLMAK